MENKSKKLVCECGNRTKFDIISHPDDDNEYGNWIQIDCKNCGKSLFYNGA